MSALLVNYLNNVASLSPALQTKLYSIIQTKEVEKNEFLLKAGQISDHIYFIESGFIRSFYEMNGKETTAWFMGANDFIISVASFFCRIKSQENIQALEKSTVHFIEYNELEALYADHIEFNIVGRILTTHYYVLSEERLYNIRNQSAQERYLFLLDKHPDIFLKASLKQIASYLGITPETLSRERAAIKR